MARHWSKVELVSRDRSFVKDRLRPRRQQLASFSPRATTCCVLTRPNHDPGSMALRFPVPVIGSGPGYGILCRDLVLMLRRAKGIDNVLPAVAGSGSS